MQNKPFRVEMDCAAVCAYVGIRPGSRPDLKFQQYAKYAKYVQYAKYVLNLARARQVVDLMLR